MNDDTTRAILAVVVVAGFFGVVGIVLFGFVNVDSPPIAKLAGLIFGYLTGIMQPVITRYFKET